MRHSRPSSDVKKRYAWSSSQMIQKSIQRSTPAGSDSGKKRAAGVHEDGSPMVVVVEYAG